jgi:hypothetical protein
VESWRAFGPGAWRRRGVEAWCRGVTGVDTGRAERRSLTVSDYQSMGESTES